MYILIGLVIVVSLILLGCLLGKLYDQQEEIKGMRLLLKHNRDNYDHLDEYNNQVLDKFYDREEDTEIFLETIAQLEA